MHILGWLVGSISGGAPKGSFNLLPCMCVVSVIRYSSPGPSPLTSDLLCLSSCQYHTVLITTALYYSLKSGSMMPPALFFFLRVALAIQGLLWFHTNFRIVCSVSVKNIIGILIRIALNL